MAYKTVLEFVDTTPPKEYGLNLDALVEKGVQTRVTEVQVEVPKKRGPGRPPKNSYNNANVYTDTETIVKANKTTSPEAQYEKGYMATTKLLYGSIGQADTLYQTIENELQEMRERPTKGGKMRSQIMADYMGTQVGLINTKVNAIRELDSIRHKINDLVMKKMQIDKDTKDENSDKAVMDAYYALVNASNYGLPHMQAPLSPTSINTGVNLAGNRLDTTSLIGADIVPANPDMQALPGSAMDGSFEDYKNNLTPIQRKMILDNDPNIKTVVVYDQSTGRKYFDVINIQTGQSVPGVTRPGDFLLDNMRIDARNGIAVNSNVNQSYPLVIIGSRVSDEL